MLIIMNTQALCGHPVAKICVPQLLFVILFYCMLVIN